jgi:hypothetical protein
MILSEFCCAHESTLSDVTDLLCGHVSQDLTPDNTAVVEAGILGLRSIAGMTYYFLMIMKNNGFFLLRILTVSVQTNFVEANHSIYSKRRRSALLNLSS